MTDDLDTRARAAATALHESVRGLSVDTPRTQRPRPRLAIAAAVVVAVVAVAIALRNQGPDNTDVVTDNAGDVPRFVLDVPPPGLLPTGAVDLPLAGPGAPAQTYWVYGDPDAPNPFDDGDLGVVVSNGPDVAFVPPDDAREVEVDGRRVWVAMSLDPLDPRSVTFEVDGDSVAYLASTTLSDEALVDAAAELNLEDGGAGAPEAVAGLRLVAVSTAEPTGTIPLPLPATNGHIAGYQSEDETGRSIVVASVAGGDDAYLVARWALGPTAREITVRGADGWVGAPYGLPSTLVLWRESPTNVVAVFAGGIEEAIVLDAASSLRDATEGEWDALRSLSGRAPVPSDALGGVSTDEGDGHAFAAYLDADGSLCLDVETAEGSSGSCGGGDTGPLVVQVGALGDGSFVVYGYTTLGTDGDLLITADGGSAGSEAYYEGGTVFAFTVAADQIPAEIVVQGPDGTELGRVAVPAAGAESGGSAPTTISAPTTLVG